MVLQQRFRKALDRNRSVILGIDPRTDDGDKVATVDLD
jgi:hypothetical protein